MSNNEVNNPSTEETTINEREITRTRTIIGRMLRRIGNFFREHKALTLILALISFYTFCNSTRDRVTSYFQNEKKQTFDARKFRVLVPLQANTKEYLEYMKRDITVSYSSTPYNLDGLRKEYSSKVSKNILEMIIAANGHWFEENRKLTKERIDFYFFPEGTDSDENSYQRSFEKALVKAKYDDREIIALIGNVSSSVTKKYGEFCGKDNIEITKENAKILKDKEIKLRKNIDNGYILPSKIPMLLPLATATSLTDDLRVSGVPALIRLPPANDKQAKFISDFLLNIKNKNSPALKAVIAKDLSNPVYSEDLVENFRANYVQQPLKDIQDMRAKTNLDLTVPDNFGRILSVIPIGNKPGQFSSPFLYPTIKSLNPDTLIIFGMTNTSLETLAQTKASGLVFKYIILSDGAVDEYLVPRIASLVNNQVQNIYLTFPLPCSIPKEVERILSPTLQSTGIDIRQDFSLTHALYVADSAFIVLDLLEKIVNDESMPSEDGRILIGSSIKKWQDSATNETGNVIDVKFPKSDRSYKIDRFGNVINIDYHLFHAIIKNKSRGTVLDVDWVHDKEQCPLKQNGLVEEQMLDCSKVEDSNEKSDKNSTAKEKSIKKSNNKKSRNKGK